MPKPETVSAEEILARATANLKTTTVLPEKPAPESHGQLPATDGAFAAQNGQLLYKYEVDGQTYILPKPVEECTQEDIDRMGSLPVSSTPGRVPQDLWVKFKDPQWAGFWFNRKAKDGVRVGWARSAGFVPVKCEELEWYAAHLNDTDGALLNGDLILMKIHKAKLLIMNKQNTDQARRQGGIERYKTEAQNTVGGDPNKIEFFHTPHATKEFQGLGPVTNLPTVGR